MKNRILAVVLALTMVILCLTACKKGDADTETVDNTVEENNEEEETEIPSPDVAKRIEPKVKVRGIYVTGAAAGKDTMDELIELCDRTDINAMVIDVKDDLGNITYNMDLDMVKEIGAVYEYVSDMPALIKKLHEHGIYCIARIVCFKDPILAKGRDDLALKLPSGEYVVDGHGNPFVNPYKKEVHEYIVSVAKKAIEIGFDEIQFDYVRFPIGEDADNADYGVNTKRYTKMKCISSFFTYCETEFHKEGIIFGADLFGTIIGSDLDEEATGQVYKDIAMKADNVCPMIYPSHFANGNFGLDVPDAKPYEAILGALGRSNKALEVLSEESRAYVRPWLQAFTAPWVPGHIEYKLAEIKAQIQAVYDAGYDEWILWNAGSFYDYE
ncbi:MAG: putative glycoside hydrolase [Lachnospiraceae bacterium]|nr:putative glycoside hydrolase [Lachnospiraceae bacterium]MBR5788802.1 putative glycoside hydrolase [Lachnospiraceae bacterium]